MDQKPSNFTKGDQRKLTHSEYMFYYSLLRFMIDAQQRETFSRCGERLGFATTVRPQVGSGGGVSGPLPAGGAAVGGRQGSGPQTTHAELTPSINQQQTTARRVPSDGSGLQSEGAGHRHRQAAKASPHEQGVSAGNHYQAVLPGAP